MLNQLSHPGAPYLLVLISISLWLMMLNIFSHDYLPSVCLLWSNVSVSLLSIFFMNCLGFFLLRVFFLSFYLSNLYTPCGAWTHNFEIKSCMVLWLSQPGTPGLLVFLLLSFESSLYAQDPSPCQIMWLANIFSQSVSCLFIHLAGSFTEQKFLFWMRSSLTIFSFYELYIFWSSLRTLC